MLLTLLGRMGLAGDQWVLVVVSTILVAAHYVLIAPACTGGTDPLVPPWLLRSQRRAEAVNRPLVQLVSVLCPTLMLALGVSGPVVLGVCLGLQLTSLLLVLLALPRLATALR